MGCKELKFKVIYRFRNSFTIEELCKLLEVSRSGYYKWLKRKDEPDKDKIRVKTEKGKATDYVIVIKYDDYYDNPVEHMIMCDKLNKNNIDDFFFDSILHTLPGM